MAFLTLKKMCLLKKMLTIVKVTFILTTTSNNKYAIRHCYCPSCGQFFRPTPTHKEKLAVSSKH